MASTSGSPAVEETRNERKRKRGATGESEGPEAQPSKWRTRRVHEIYSSKLLDAIRLVRSGSPSAASAAAPPRSRAVREAADRALAVSARGRTRWSRAILASHHRRIQAARRARLREPTSPPSRHPSSPCAKGPKAPALARKAKVLGRLVPGCRKLPFPALLAEASDYIAALEMQVRAMTALAEVLSTVSASTSAASDSSGGSSSPA
ncbi:transcription factor bHLH149-like [Oryza brachyantha]|nr:transcription factor bHLH149-like [Oryza brachyantha]